MSNDAQSAHKGLTFTIKYLIVSAFILLACFAIVYKMVQTSIFQHEEWELKSDSLRREGIPVAAQRGNILSCNNDILASSIPEYSLYIDFRVGGLNGDTLNNLVAPLSKALADKFKTKSAKQYEEEIREAYKRRKGRYKIHNKRVTYLDYLEIKEFPLLNKGGNKSGFFVEIQTTRLNPFGTVARRTIGALSSDGGKDGEYGVEEAYNTQLKGKDGVSDIEKVRDTWVYREKVKEVNGSDIRTSLDVKIQCIAEQALEKMLIKHNAESGSVIVMETKTGEIKAITNLTQVGSNGGYYEVRNNAIASMVEPGSTFKTVAIMAALDEGKIKPNEIFDAGDGLWMYGTSRMTDHNRNKGGYGELTVAEAIQYSSNIATSKAVLKYYENHQEEFINKLKKMGICDSVDLKMAGQAYPKVPHPKTSKGWNKTTLPWMTFGYNVQIPPIYTLMFYNAIANNGKMVAPIFVTDIINDDLSEEHIKTSVVREAICKPQTLKEIRQMLTDVVEKGTASMLKSDYIKIAGKTGTAQISQGKGGYKSSKTQHRVSFCGYFPDNDNPQYSCIAVVTNPRVGYPSGGGITGMIVKEIAEQMYAQRYFGDLPMPQPDSIFRAVEPKTALYAPTVVELKEMGIGYSETLSKTPSSEQPVRVTQTQEERVVVEDIETDKELVPNVIGMGLRDALYTLELSGFNVKVVGRGEVVEQTPQPNSKIESTENATIHLK